MSRHTRPYLVLAVLFGVVIASAFYAGPDVVGDSKALLRSAAVAVGAVLMVGLFLFALVGGNTKVPDLLKAAVGSYFDQSGFSFAPRLKADAGRASFDIHFQNRWSGPCVAKVVCRPVDGLSRTGPPHDIPPVAADVRCGGGQMGIVRIPYAINRRWQGREMVYKIACTAEFPEGKGARVSDDQGMAVGPIKEDYFVVVAGALAGDVRVPLRGAEYRVVLPADVADVVPAGRPIRTEILFDAKGLFTPGD
jgi:hypothetical protein